MPIDPNTLALMQQAFPYTSGQQPVPMPQQFQLPVQQPVMMPQSLNIDTSAVDAAYKSRPDNISEKVWRNASNETKQKIHDMQALQHASMTPYQQAMKQHPFLMGLSNFAMGLGQGITKQPYLTDFQNNQASLQRQSMDMINDQVKPSIYGNASVPVFSIDANGKPIQIGEMPKGSKMLPQSTQPLSPDQIMQTAQMMVEKNENGTPKLSPSQIPGRNGRLQAIAAARALDPTYSPAQADINFAVDKLGAPQFAKRYNNLDAYHRNFLRSADLTLKYSGEVDRSASPLINKAIMSGNLYIAGDPAATKLAQQMYTTAMEFARIQNPTLSGTALSDSARAEATDILNRWQSGAQLEALLGQDGSMRLDSQNMIDTAKEKLDELRGQKKESTQGTNSTGSLQKIGRFQVQVH